MQKTVADEFIDALVSFSSSAWVEELFEGASMAQMCAIHAVELDPTTAGIDGVVRAWHVIFGDANTGTAGCGYFAQVGPLSNTASANLTYVLDMAPHDPDNAPCPASLVNNPPPLALITLPNYFAKTAAPAPPQLSGGVIAGIVVCSVALLAGGVAGFLYATGRWVPPCISRERAHAFERVGGEDVPTASDFTSVNAFGEPEEDEVECLPVAAAANLAKDAAQSARRAMSFTVQ